jgi:hypothetical protein
MSIDWYFLEHVALTISVILNILLYLRRFPFNYFYKRYIGAQERKNKFYEPLIEDLNKIVEKLKDYHSPSPSEFIGLEEKHLSLLISKRTKSNMEKLIKILDEMKDAYYELKYHVYPLILLHPDINDNLKKVEINYLACLSDTSVSGDSIFTQRLKDNDSAIGYFLKCAGKNKKVKYSEFPTIQDLIQNIEKAHVNHQFEWLLNKILLHLQSSYTFKKVLKIRKRCLKLSRMTLKLLENEAKRLSSKILGVIYGAGNQKLLNSYIEKRKNYEQRYLTRHS